MNGELVEGKELLTLAVEIATEAGELIKTRRDAVTRMAVSATKSTPTDVVTESDTAAESLIRDRIHAARPGDGILGEEGGSAAGSTGVEWIVDPIDGTVNYLYGIPQYAVSIAVNVGGHVVAGVVHNPASGETWTATKGGGAFLGDVRIAESGCDRLDQALIGTGFGYDAARREKQARILARIMSSIRDVRRAGAASLDLCAVATGRLDGYYERGLGRWDYAAGALVAQEAGAVIGGIGGRPASGEFLLAAGPGLFDALHDLLAPLGPDHDD
jgi:myo-inositol-1(or 4)-monophosphatase